MFVFINEKTSELVLYESPFATVIYARIRMGKDYTYLGTLE